MSTVTIVISIGRNVGNVPLDAKRWEGFCTLVRTLLAESRVYVYGAESIGVWNGVSEDSRTWVAETSTDKLEDIRSSLRAFAKLYEQDAIALTVGQTELVA